jgi:hypothetical protein
MGVAAGVSDSELITAGSDVFLKGLKDGTRMEDRRLVSAKWVR